MSGLNGLQGLQSLQGPRRLGDSLRRALEIAPGEEGRLGWLLLHSLSNGLFSALFFSAALATFLGEFGTSLLPFAYVGSALVGYVGVSLYAGLGRRLSLGPRLAAPLATVLAAALGLWLVAVRTDSSWVAFALMVSALPAIALVDLELWGLATHLFDLRQGRRLFGLVGAGDVVAATLGFFLVPLLVSRLGGPIHLLPLAAAGLFGSLAVLSVAVRRVPAKARAPAADRSRRAAAVPWSDRYFLLLAALAALFVMTLYLLDFAFLGEVSRLYAGGGATARFFGVFYGVEKVCELAMKTLVANRIVSRFGLRAGLLVLPATLGLCLLGVGAVGALAFGGILFFALVALTKLVWLVLWRSLYEPSYRVLYQPLPPERQLALQGRVEGTVRQLATLLVGVGLVYHSAHGAGPLALVLLLLPASLAWMFVVSRVHREYRSRLLQAIEQPRGEAPLPGSAGSAGSAGAPRERGDAVLPLLLDAGPAAGLTSALVLLGRVDPEGSAGRLTALLERGGTDHCAAALEQIAHRRLLAALPAVEASAGREGPPELRAAALRTAAALCEVRDLAGSRERLLALARSADPADRELAAVAAGWAGAAGRDALAELLWDKGWNVRRAALIAAGRSRIPEFRSRLLAHLAAVSFANAAATAAALAGEPLLPELEAAFGRAPATDQRLRILGVYERIGGPAVLALFAEQIRSPEPAVQERALAWLARQGYRAGREQVPVLKRWVEALIESTAWDLAAAVDLAGETTAAAVCECLREQVEGARRRLVLLLSLLCDPGAITRVEESLASGSSEAAVYALEILDLAVSPDLRPLVLPLIEDLPPAQRLHRLETFAPQRQMAPAARLAAVLQRDADRTGSWTKAFALEALGALAGDEIPESLLAFLFHPDPLLQEVAAWTLLRRDRAAYARNLRRLPLPEQARLERVLAADEEGHVRWETRAAFGRAVHLRGVPAFARLPWEVLTALGAASDERRLTAGDHLPSAKDPPVTLYVIVEGEVAPAPEAPAAGRGETLFAGRDAPWEARAASRLIRFDGDRLVLLAAEQEALLLALLAITLRPAAAPEVPLATAVG